MERTSMSLEPDMDDRNDVDHNVTASPTSLEDSTTAATATGNGTGTTIKSLSTKNDVTTIQPSLPITCTKPQNPQNPTKLTASNKTTPMGTLAADSLSVSTAVSSMMSTSNTTYSAQPLNIAELAYWVPLRLTADERALLNVLEQALHVSEYTDNVDVTSFGGGSGSNYYRTYNSNYNTGSVVTKTRRILDGILEVCHIATGLATASGQERKFFELCYRKISSSNSNNTLPVKTPSLLGDGSISSRNNSVGGGMLSVVSNSFLSRQEKKQLRAEKKQQRRQLKEEKRSLKKTKKNSVATNELAEKEDDCTAAKKGLNGVNGSSSSSSSSSKNQEMKHNPEYVSWACREPHENAILFQTMFEIGRRNKVLNPSSMRTTYGKLMYILQDSQNPAVAKSLGFSLHKDLLLIGPYLEQNQCNHLLRDSRLECAIQYISDRDLITGEKIDRVTLEAMLQGKQRVVDELVQHYSAPQNTNPTDSIPNNTPVGGFVTSSVSSSLLSSDDVRRVIESLADAVVYIESNVRPVQAMLQYLKQNFHPDHDGQNSMSTSYGIGGSNSGIGMNSGKNGRSTVNRNRFSSLSLRGGSRSSNNDNSSSHPGFARYGLSAYGGSGGSSEGPTLSHGHSEQYTFVEQSLKLWCKVMRQMHCLWVCADDDLLSTQCSYHLYNTGQGLNRVQSCPRVRKVMSSLLHQTQQETGKHWVGLSVVHLGDRDVPNALIFIDKYTQIPRFLNPIVNFLQCVPSTVLQDERMAHYVYEQFGSVENLKMLVLQDYFKHGFDGSGDDGGSCIDGRLTSSWNWTSRLTKKPYYYAFMMLSGFQGFDGEFR